MELAKFLTNTNADVPTILANIGGANDVGLASSKMAGCATV